MKEAPPPPTLDPKDYYAVMVHFYRGELGRIMIWRQRLDVTTNWAIVAASGIVTYALGHQGSTHFVLYFANLLVLLMLVIEARRYRFYDAFRARVRMLEAHFIMPVLVREPGLLQGDWRELLAEDLVQPTFKISRLEAIARRFRRNYGWIFSILFLAWAIKVWTSFPSSHTWSGFVTAVEAHQPLPAPVFWALIAALYGTLLFLLVLAFRLGNCRGGELSTTTPRPEQWRI